MKTLSRNKQRFFYAQYLEKFLLYDDDGDMTGEREIKYSSPVCCHANISPASGMDIIQQFGINERYDKIIVSDELDLPINEYSVLWVDNEPVLNRDGTTDTPYDYIVKRVAKSLNSVSFAITKVNASGN